jgi:hypothetical protein
MLFSIYTEICSYNNTLISEYQGQIRNSIKQILSSKTNSHLTNQETPHIFWNYKVHYSVHKSSPLVSILGQINPVHTVASYSLISLFLLTFSHKNSVRIFHISIACYIYIYIYISYILSILFIVVITLTLVDDKYNY